MATGNLRREVLNSFKALHKTRLKVFDGDMRALNFAREKINESYKKNKNITEENIITEQLALAKAVEVEMRTTIVQAKEVKPGVYEAKFNPETVKMDNIPFNDSETEIEFTTKRKGNKVEITKKNVGCCQQQGQST